MPKPVLTASILTLFASLFLFVIGPSPVDRKAVTGGKDEEPFLVPVVAGGVPPDGQPHKLATDLTNDGAGMDLWIGAKTAFDRLTQNNAPSSAARLNNLGFKLWPINDDNDTKSAGKFAREIERNPRVLAVVGHGITATTQVGASAYDKVGIPLIVALATGSEAVYREDQPAYRFPHAFRLPPTDDMAQAPSIVYLAAQLKPRAIHIVEGMQGNTRQYSAPLAEKIKEIATAKKFDVHLDDRLDLNSIVRSIHRDHPKGDVIIFCGYIEEARNFLEALEQEYSKDSGPPSRPSLIFSEGSPGIEGSKSSFPVYRMSPLDSRGCPDSEELKSLSQAGAQFGRQLSADEIHGYDAIQLIAYEAKKCAQRLSRACLLEQLQATATFPSVCIDYSFREGEESVAHYFVFPSKDAPVPPELAPVNKALQSIMIGPQNILHMLTLANMQTEYGPQYAQ